MLRTVPVTIPEASPVIKRTGRYAIKSPLPAMSDAAAV